MSKKNKFISMLAVVMMMCVMLCTVATAGSKYDKYELNKVGYICADTSVNVRKGPGTAYKVYDCLRRGKKVSYYKYNKKWYLIKYKGRYAFVRSKYVSSKKVKARKVGKSPAKYSPRYFRRMGVIRWNGWRWTWYSQRVLPGGGLKIPGRHVDGKGYVCDKNGYICLASGKLRKGTIVRTPFGKSGKVYDCGCAANTLDVYVNW